MTRALARTPLRWRLTMVALIGAVAVLAGLGALLHVRLERSLDESLARALRTQAADVAALVSGSGGVESATSAEGRLVQLVARDGSLVEGTATLGATPVPTRSELARARRSDVVIERRGLVEPDEGTRFLVRALPSTGGTVLVVGASTEPIADALESLRVQLMLVAPLALALVGLAAYALAGAALRPVERMRSEAEAVSARAPGVRLTVPPADDEVGRLATTLNAMLARLEDAVERERRFVADAGHELRTPLANLRIELELAAMEGRSHEELVAAIVSAGEEADRLSRLAEDLLALARAADGRLEVRAEPVDVDALLRRVADRHAATASGAGRTLTVGEPTGVVVQGDGARLEQALDGLVDNALRHGRGTVALDAIVTADRVELHVRDEGEGIDGALGVRAFEPFAKADPARGGTGAGLGLALVQEIAVAHGGAAGVTPGRSDVWIAVPGRAS